MNRGGAFRSRWLPYALVGPQIAVTLVFFLWPAAQALVQSLFVEDAFGTAMQFVGLDNFAALLADPHYARAFATTAVFAGGVTTVSLGAALILAVLANRVARGATLYRSLVIWPYAVAPALAGVLWLFLFDPSVGTLAFALKRLGVDWNPLLDGGQAMTLVILAAAWKQVSYNFVFFLAGLQAIPRALLEAAAIDGAGPWSRFRRIVLPLLSPTAFFLAVVNVIYAFFDTFGVIDAATSGGPAKATEVLVYKVFHDGFKGQDFGSAAAQSVILMAIVIALTVAQFRFIERKVVY
ncbi:MAG: sn-glycerol-3-phosphate ABC transporter permease UgpA [Burkholderiales bacterium]|nr:sn-glycerol-3-phosphate ABC transporter permease UgpA [Burkholderiales bacterium]